MSGPARIQLSRQGGWRKPVGAVVVSRPSKWGNPWRVTEERPADGAGPRYRLTRGDKGMVGPSFNLRSTAIFFAVQEFRRDLVDGRLSITCADVVAELAGKVLGCWCEPGQPCHADVLLEVANGTASS